MTENASITSLVEQRLDEIETQFTSEIDNEINELLADIAQLRVLIPEEMHSCVNDDVTR